MFELTDKEITTGSLKKALAFLTVPIVVQQLALSAQQVVDVLWLGRLDSAAVAAVGLVQPIIGLILAIIGATFGGVQILVSQRIGSDDHKGAQRVTIHGLVLAVSLMIGVVMVIYVFASDIVTLLNSDPKVTQFASTYLIAITVAYTIAIISDTFEAGFIGAGDSRTPLFANLLAIITNAVLDPFLILGWGPFPKFGISGAAYATLIGYLLSSILIIGIAFSSRGGFSLTRKAFDPNLNDMYELLRVGGPQAGGGVGRQTARLLMVSLVSLTGGAAAVTAYTIGARIATFVFVPAIGIGKAATTIVGQNLGAKQPDRATKGTWLSVTIGTIGLGSFGIIQWFYPVELAQLFVPSLGGQTLIYTISYLQILAYGYWALAAIHTVVAGFNGAGRTEISMYAILLQYWAIRVPIAALMAFFLGYGALGPFWAITISNVVTGIGLVLAFRRFVGRGMYDEAVKVRHSSAD